MFRIKAPASFRRDDRGATAVEFALVAPLLFFSLLSLVEIGTIGMISSGLDNAAFDAARRIRTGRDDAATSADSFETQICEQLGGSVSSCKSRLTISVQKYPRFYEANAMAAAQPAGQFDKGGPGDIVMVKVNYRWPLMTPFLATAYQRSGPLDITIASRAAFKNEPYE